MTLIFDLQPSIENALVRIRPLAPADFESLYKIASDPLIWEQHPNKNRYRRPDFENFFKGAIESGGAFLVSDAASGETIGSSRFCELDALNRSVSIGYTFLARSHWGGIYNPALKALMLDHAFRFADTVVFHIGACNIRSQRAIERLGAQKTGEAKIEYYGEASALNFIYSMQKEDWKSRK